MQAGVKTKVFAMKVFAPLIQFGRHLLAVIESREVSSV
jgi:hypothetical protein